MEIRAFIEDPDASVEAYARERVELVIGRFADRIGHVDMHLACENSRHGNDEFLCTFDIKLTPRGIIHVSAKNETSRSAIVKAVHRAESALAKVVDRGHRSRSVRHNGGGVRHLSDSLDSVAPATVEEKTAEEAEE